MKLSVEIETMFRLKKLAESSQKTVEEIAAFLLARGLQTAQREASVLCLPGLQTGKERRNER